ncbi:MAG: glycine--tRNA ligase [Candidatus Babeliaceae bacterium]|nr:glycine--tRNA ligase [Candidatus Babeliaceae bacterium]
MVSTVTLDKLVSLCKRRGFIFQTADIYGGLNGVYDAGPLGTLMKSNVRALWQQSLQRLDKDIVFIDGALLGPETMWKASGHLESFHDPLVECKSCNSRFRADDVDLARACPRCGKTDWTDVREFHLMFKTQLGASVEQSSVAYLRPETAQSVFVNFKNVWTTSRVKIPFGIAQIGKAFRNEITPKQFLFRMREFEQMELEWFCTEATAREFFDFWATERTSFYKSIGVNQTHIRLRSHEKEELSHYSTATSDVEYEFPFGWKELEGIAYRGCYDLSQHAQHSKKDLAVFDEETKESYTPHVIECSVGVDRLFLTLLFNAYCEEAVEGEVRTVLRLHPSVAPIKAAFLPLVNKLAEPCERIYAEFKKCGISVQFDVSGSIGKRYRRQDEIGTPYCFTYDFESAETGTVTVRHRDSMKQERIAINSIASYITHTSPFLTPCPH